MDISNKKLLNAANYQGYSFNRLWIIKEKLTSSGKITPPPPPSFLTQIRVKESF